MYYALAPLGAKQKDFPSSQLALSNSRRAIAPQIMMTFSTETKGSTHVTVMG